MHVSRLRQVVVAAHDRDDVHRRVTEAFGFGPPFHDPGVGAFGLHNCVYPVGDQFFEIVSPIQEHTTAGRYLERHGGDAGYMVIFQVDDIAAARAHLQAERCRTVWSADLPSIAATHLHPVDIGGAIVSIDQPQPASSWLWGGPDWEANVRTAVVDGVAGITVSDVNPAALIANWTRLLRLSFDAAGMSTLPDGSVIRIVDASGSEAGGRTGLVGIALRATDRAAVGRVQRIAGTDLALV